MNTSPSTSDDSVVKPTVIDLDADQVIDHDSVMNDTAATPPAKKRSRNGLVLPSLALIAGVIGGGWLYRDVLQTYLPSDQMAAMATRLNTVEQSNGKLVTQLEAIERLSTQLKTDVDAIEDATTATQGETKTLADGLGKTQSTLDALQSQIAEARTSITELANRPVATEGSSAVALPPDIAMRLANIEKDIASLKATGGAAAQDKAALAQALSDLKAKVESGLSFAGENERIARMVPAATGLDILNTHAAAGLPTAQGLALELSAIQAAMPKPDAASAAPVEKGWWETITDSLSDLIVIRDADNQDWRVVADQARAFAESGDLAQAISVLDETEGTKPVELQGWRDKADARLKLEAAVNAVGDAVTRTLAAGQ
jgi:hypothetical protein